jgi:hypothetical protein
MDLFVSQQWLPDLTLDTPRLAGAGFCVNLESLNIRHFKTIKAID